MKVYQRSVFLWLLLPPLLLVAACGQNPIDPDGFTGRTGGCGNFSLHKFNADMTEAVAINANTSAIAFDRTPRDFNLPHPAFNVRIERFPAPAYTYYCDDVGGDAEPIRVWTAVSGTVKVAAGDTLEVQPPFDLYKVFVSLHNVTFRDQFGEQVFIKELDYGEVMVGWLPG